MRTYLGWLLAAVALPLTAYAQEATIKEVHDKPAVKGSIIANMLQEHDNPFTLYPYDTNYVIYTQTSDLNKEAISSYNWSDNARKDEVKFQLSLAFPFWRGILAELGTWRVLHAEVMVAALQQRGIFTVPRNQL